MSIVKRKKENQFVYHLPVVILSAHKEESPISQANLKLAR